MSLFEVAISAKISILLIKVTVRCIFSSITKTMYVDNARS